MHLHWTDLTRRFPEESECLAGFVAWQAAEVVAGAKPANLINIFDRDLACGRNIRSLWEQHKSTVLAAAGLQVVELAENSDRLLVLIHRPTALSSLLAKGAVQRTLTGLGYAYNNPDEALAHLQQRVRGDEFPHEIGFFLGYPVKDVLGFMGLLDLPLTDSGPWRMYGRLEKSHAAKNLFRRARQSVHEALVSEPAPLLLLQKMRPGFLRAA